MKDISKSFTGVNVLRDVHFKLEKGTVHALMGENGAGKSTLMKILAGITKSDKGSICINGKSVEINSPSDSQNLGIAMIHQELSPIPGMTVAENIYFGREPGKSVFVDYRQLYKQTEELLDRLHIKNISPREKLQNLQVADQQLIEIAKAISYNAEIIIMDEPTSAITDKEVENLFVIINNLRKAGKGIIYISHKMDEVFRISDEITVLRDGAYVDSWKAKDINNDILIRNMVGRELSEIFPKVHVPIGEKVLEVRNLTLQNKFHNINFDVRRGEILGIAGLVGAGRTEVMQALFGLTPADEGEIIFEGKKLNPREPREAIKNGLAFVTEDRKGEGLVPYMSVAHNITLASMKDFDKNFLIDMKSEDDVIQKQIASLRIRSYGKEQLVTSLSGGNQQKVVLAKWLIKKPKLLILDEPTRGIDVGAKSEIYKIMCDFVAKGNSIIMISSEMPEVMGMADRIVVLSNRRLGGELNREEFVQENIMRLAVSKM
ncbi:sugar ABC transporter ATP-binding protein [Ruminiclostridium cellobioparum]|uniref:ABC-type sugar transport system, ATPase component n=1 Tax=Ruminiclostridium cellobioparum subsp. termitidis CT1112 TaxID=1195236 RepID=S0FMN1_RUMCE|nr:sugar ABC transporter ATP-binding protein [Ruminiclostridium cellobioparum]EMS71606.1 ABC-type sugar transport system, ATPase component [Ruminiclostridium cellobioparum subsp. termitidis CT1112]